MTGGSPDFIRVGAVFETDGIRPVWFAAGGHKVKIAKIHYSWTERDAEEFYYDFTVSDGSDFYRLRLSARQMRWTMQPLE